MHSLFTNTTQFYIKHLNICRFGVCGESWNQTSRHRSLIDLSLFSDNLSDDLSLFSRIHGKRTRTQSALRCTRLQAENFPPLPTLLPTLLSLGELQTKALGQAGFCHGSEQIKHISIPLDIVYMGVRRPDYHFHCATDQLYDPKQKGGRGKEE